MVFFIHLREKRVESAAREQDKLISNVSIDLFWKQLVDSGNIRPSNNWHSI
jgi:hypothetical protein